MEAVPFGRLLSNAFGERKNPWRKSFAFRRRR